MTERSSTPKSLAGWRGYATALRSFAGKLGGGRNGSTGWPVALALQGGGAHGAFTWGVLDAMLDRGIVPEAISGTSAGAFNAVFLAQGWLDGGADGARESLATLWRRIGAKASFSPLRASLMDQMARGWNLDHASSHVGFDLFTRVLSPYQFNPLDMNPLRDLLREHIDFARLRRNRRIRLFVGATEVESGKPRTFETAEISEQAVLASATLPWVHHAVAIDGRHYWDGGFTANPPLLPLIVGSQSRDVFLLRLDTGEAAQPPVSARAIQARLNRMLFTGPLERDLEELAMLRDLAGKGALSGALGRRLRHLDLHVICGGDMLEPFGQSSKLNPQRGFLRELHALGLQRGAEALAGRHGAAALLHEARS